MDEPAAPSQSRKLASIVSIDITGYSRLAEADEAAAVAAVNAVRARIDRANATHGGRIFSTAGDGFMLEFPTASGALLAAEEIANGEGPMVRIGVHAGEVSSTESGDMLGHGVNIAARLQQMAQPGHVLVSADVKRSVRGDLGARLTPRGEVKLDKMSETLPVFQLDSIAQPTRTRLRVDWRWAAGGVALAAAIGAVVLLTNHPSSPATTRIAVLPFRALGGDATLTTFSDGLSDRIVSTLSSRSILTVSPDDAVALQGPDAERRRTALGIGLVLDGTVQGSSTISVDARIEDPRTRSVLWSASLQGDSSQAANLQARVAARVVAEMYCGSRAFRPVGGLTDPTALAAYLRACDLFLVHHDDNQTTYELLASLRQVTSIAPNFSAAHSDIAKYEAYSIERFPEDQIASVSRDANTEAHRALQLDPHNADAYVALFLLGTPGQWAEGEQVLRQGLAIDPDWPHANGFLGNQLTAVGRLREASVHYQRAAAANPLSGGLSWSGQSAVGLDNIGRADLADQALTELTRLWSNEDPDVWRVRYQIAFAERRWDYALAMLNERSGIPQWFTPSDIATNREFLLAAKAGTRPRLEAERRSLLAQATRGGPGLPVRGLVALGFIDDAFAVLDSWNAERLLGSSLTYYLFTPTLAPLHRDPRFMHLASRLGLITYWRATHTQPDFCSEPNLPYNCVVEEERAQPTTH